jgi:hypothetical protein
VASENKSKKALVIGPSKIFGIKRLFEKKDDGTEQLPLTSEEIQQKSDSDERSDHSNLIKLIEQNIQTMEGHILVGSEQLQELKSRFSAYSSSTEFRLSELADAIKEQKHLLSLYQEEISSNSADETNFNNG